MEYELIKISKLLQQLIERQMDNNKLLEKNNELLTKIYNNSLIQ